MASPVLQSVCCIYGNVSSYPHVGSYAFVASVNTFNGLCLLSSTISIFGACMQILPRKTATAQYSEESKRQNFNIMFLAIADLLASAGILIRSIVWLSGQVPWRFSQSDTSSFRQIFCTIISALIQYFYLCTYMWTMIYAIDMYRIVHQRAGKLWLYHLCAWMIPASLLLLGTVPFYTPNLMQCHNNSWSWLPHFVVSYLPIVLVMIVNPIIYSLSLYQVENGYQEEGIFGNFERAMINIIKQNFLCINIIFYICWSVNIIHGVLLFSSGRYFIYSPSLFLFIWSFMAIVNPLQAFLNSLVYRGWLGCWPCAAPVPKIPSENVQNCENLEVFQHERSPLIAFQS